MMNCAYEASVVPIVQRLMGGMLDYATYGLGMELDDFYNMFLESKYPEKIARIDSRTVMGTSGIELCCDIAGKDVLTGDLLETYEYHAASGRSPEYWCGWAIAYYQWKSSMSFADIAGIVDISSVYQMYRKYHEMDITQFVDKLDDIYREKNPDTRLKIMRTRLGLSQRELAERACIPIKTIQQYEQRQKNINHANVDYLISLSKALYCDIDLLIEKV